MDYWDKNCLCYLHTTFNVLLSATNIMKIYKDFSVVPGINNTSANHKLLLGCITAAVHDLKHVPMWDTKLKACWQNDTFTRTDYIISDELSSEKLIRVMLWIIA